MSKTIYQLAIEHEQHEASDLLHEIVNNYYSALREYYEDIQSQDFKDFMEQKSKRSDIQFNESLQNVLQEPALIILQKWKEEFLNHLEKISNPPQPFLNSLNLCLKYDTLRHINFYRSLIYKRYRLLRHYFLFHDSNICKVRDFHAEENRFFEAIANISSYDQKLSVLLNKKDELLQRIKNVLDESTIVLYS